MAHVVLIVIMLAAGIVNGWTSLGFAMVAAAVLIVFVVAVQVSFQLPIELD